MGDGKLNFENFLSLMTRPMKNSEVQDELKEVFTEFDRNGDGILDTNDVAQAFQLLLGDNPTLVEVEEMLRERGWCRDRVRLPWPDAEHLAPRPRAPQLLVELVQLPGVTNRVRRNMGGVRQRLGGFGQAVPPLERRSLRFAGTATERVLHSRLCSASQSSQIVSCSLRTCCALPIFMGDLLTFSIFFRAPKRKTNQAV